MKITVIGARGRMGSWFTRYFSTQGHEIYAYDIIDNGNTAKEGYVKVIDSSSLNQVVNASDVVLLSVPIDAMLDSLKIARYMHANAILVEIASLKHGIVNRLRQYALKYGIKGLSIHPLFGPGAEIHAKNRYALIPVLDKDEELSIADSLLSNSNILVVDAEMHDKAMAYILAMVYVMNVTWSMLINSKERFTCRELGGTTYRLQSILAEGILNDDPSLFSSLLMNRYLKYYLKRFIRLNEHILTMIESKDKEGLERIYSNLKESVSSNSIENSYRLMYRILDSISSNNQFSIF